MNLITRNQKTIEQPKIPYSLVHLVLWHFLYWLEQFLLGHGKILISFVNVTFSLMGNLQESIWREVLSRKYIVILSS